MNIWSWFSTPLDVGHDLFNIYYTDENIKVNKKGFLNGIFPKEIPHDWELV
jgi:hypothetical protein